MPRIHAVSHFGQITLHLLGGASRDVHEPPNNGKVQQIAASLDGNVSPPV